MCCKTPTRPHTAIFPRAVYPASEHISKGDDRNYIAFTLIGDFRRAGGAPPPFKGGGLSLIHI
jgi:hypothetical protein